MKKILFLAAACFLVLQAASFAAVNVANVTGTIKITDSKGNVTTIKAGDPIPAIADGSTVEVVSGTADIGATDASTVTVLASGNTVNLTAGNTITVAFDSTGSSTFTAAAANTASLSVVKADSTTVALTAGGNMTFTAMPTNTADNSGKTDTTTKGAEGYTAPAVDNLGQLNTNVKSEESTADISPVK